MTNLSAGWRRLATSRLRGAIARVLRGRWTPTLHLRGLTRRGRFTSLEAGLVVILVTEIFGGRRPKDTRQGTTLTAGYYYPKGIAMRTARPLVILGFSLSPVACGGSGPSSPPESSTP